MTIGLAEILCGVMTILVGTYGFLLVWAFRKINANSAIHEEVIALDATVKEREKSMLQWQHFMANQCNTCTTQTREALREVKQAVDALHRRMDEVLKKGGV